MFLLSRNSVNAFNYAMRYNYRIFKHLTCINESNWRVCAFTDRRVIKVRGGGLFLHTLLRERREVRGSEVSFTSLVGVSSREGSRSKLPSKNYVHACYRLVKFVMNTRRPLSSSHCILSQKY